MLNSSSTSCPQGCCSHSVSQRTQKWKWTWHLSVDNTHTLHSIPEIWPASVSLHLPEAHYLFRYHQHPLPSRPLLAAWNMSDSAFKYFFEKNWIDWIESLVIWWVSVVDRVGHLCENSSGATALQQQMLVLLGFSFPRVSGLSLHILWGVCWLKIIFLRTFVSYKCYIWVKAPWNDMFQVGSFHYKKLRLIISEFLSHFP